MLSLRSPASLLLATLGAACASLPGFGPNPDEQLTAALTDLGESTATAVALETVKLRPFLVAPEGDAEPVVETDGRHHDVWTGAMIDAGLADRLCGDEGDCEPSPDLTVVGLSAPYAGRAASFVDARVQIVSDAGGGRIHTIRFLRLQMEESASGWRVVASTPLWETMR